MAEDHPDEKLPETARRGAWGCVMRGGTAGGRR